ncbi:MAG: hypothetical protein HKL86_07550 [Acidimicrobiaceae bacterium]|nr:hypothetical protein [Acidimicrobiaceae bacterium]
MSSGTVATNQGTGTNQSLRVRGLVTLVAGIAIVAAVVFGITAGAGAIWHKVTAAATAPTASSAAPVVPPSSSAVPVKLEINPPPLGGVKGSDGLIHDAFVPATFTMTVGTTYDVTMYNYDTQSHSWMAPSLNVSAVAPAGSATSPSITHFTIKPTKAGTIQWFCALPCDKWAMAHNGFMRGFVTVKA